MFASRRPPAVPLSKLRSVGEVAELGTDDLRFDAAETAQLFTETYGRRLDPDVLEDLAVRTEGWIASLQLVQAALRDRSPAEIRRFVRTLNGADHDLYDYLAEEVVGDLPDELQRFLMETSILQVVTPELAAVVSGREPDDVARLTAAAERLTLLSRRSGGPRTHQRYHPLVREFLEARLRSMDGPEVVAALHRRTAAAAASSDWKTGAHHYREAGDTEAMLGVVAGAIPTIMGNGQYALAEAFIGPISADQRPPGFDLILSRVDMQHGDYEAAIAASQAVLDSGVTDPVQRDHALLNLVTLAINYGDGDRAMELSLELQGSSSDPNIRAIADVSAAVLGFRSERDLEAINRRLRAMAQTQQATSSHHFGVTMLNLALNSVVQDRPVDALIEAREALDALALTSGLVEHSAARVLMASALLRVGRSDEAGELVSGLVSDASTYIPNEAFADAADAFDSFGSRLTAISLLDQVGDVSTHTLADKRLIALCTGRMAIRARDAGAAEIALSSYPPGTPTVVGAAAAFRLAKAHLGLIRGDGNARQELREATEFAAIQGATAIRRLGELLQATIGPAPSLDRVISVTGQSAPWHLSFLAEDISTQLPRMSESAVEVVHGAARMHPERWRTATRQILDDEVRRSESSSGTPAGSHRR